MPNEKGYVKIPFKKNRTRCPVPRAGGEEAVTYLKANRVDLLVLDMIMDPGMDGLETYQKVLEINPKQKAIIASGYSETDRVKKAQELGAGAYLSGSLTSGKKLGWLLRENWINDNLSGRAFLPGSFHFTRPKHLRFEDQIETCRCPKNLRLASCT